MIHFENIWNTAESLSKSYTQLSRKEIFGQMRKALDDLSDSEKQEDYNKALGDMLFGLCSLCAHLENKEIIINSAVSLSDAIERKRSETLDPEQPDNK